jgi:hypothetical protein
MKIFHQVDQENIGNIHIDNFTNKDIKIHEIEVEVEVVKKVELLHLIQLN